MALVIDESGTRVDFETEVVAIRGPLEIHPGEEEVEVAGGPSASVRDRNRYVHRLHGHVQMFIVGVAVVHRLGLDQGGEHVVADGVHTDVLSRNEGLELRCPVGQERQAIGLLWAEAAHDRPDTAG